MEEQRLLQFKGQLGLGDEPLFLVRVRRVVAVEVQAAFADRDHARMACQLTQRRNSPGIAVACMVRVYSGRGEKKAAFRSEVTGFPAFLDGCPRDDDLGNAIALRAREDGFKVLVEYRVGEVRADVDELHGAG